MKLITSILSFILSVVLISLAIILSIPVVQASFKDGQFDLQKLMPLSIMIVLSWLSFRLLDRLYKRVHPKMYNNDWPDNGSGPGFDIIQSLISALRSATLSLAVPVVSLGIALVGFAPMIAILTTDERMSYPLLTILVSEILLIAFLGFMVQWRYQRGVLGLMMEKSVRGSQKKAGNKTTGTSSEKLQIRVLDETKMTKLPHRGLEKQKSASRMQRRAWFRDIASPLAALTGITMVAYAQGLLNDSNKTLLTISWVLLLLVAWIGAKWRITDRTPFRQLRLGFGMWLHALLVAVCAPIALVFELSGRNGIPSDQWSVIPRLGQKVGQFLRSPRLFWIPAILIISIIPWVDKQREGIDFISLFSAGLIAYEICFRLTNKLIQRHQSNANSLVFLRVFGDSKRGQFLFSHLAPRWKGFGSITCIAAPDVSIHQLEADIGLDTLFGRLHQRFLNKDQAAIIGRHISSNNFGSIKEDHCFDDTWMSAVQSMFTQNAIILMDLRGFGPQRKGCIYELQVLRDNIPMDAATFLIDNSTDFEFLKSTLTELWKEVDKNSPNTDKHRLGSVKYSQITFYKMSESKSQSADDVIELLIEASLATEKYHQSHGRNFLQTIVTDLQLLAADADVQIKKVGGRLPGKKILEAGHSFDHDLGHTAFLYSWNLITDEQSDAISDVNEALQFLRGNSEKHSADAIKSDGDWQEVRELSRKCLKALGKRWKS